MNIIGVTACTAGIAHTYIVKEKLELSARKLGYSCRIETQGSIGIETPLTPEEIRDADVVILAIDVKISGESRFKDKPVVRMSTEKAMNNTAALLQSIEQALKKKKGGQ
ncbi:PTS fructose transporter subunit IIB [Lacrimispora sp.]|uniref:PTS fructose transporter subunit IIB n=1 Tax=Lacrimispora sp. TaxID=2719234 RepID=UPI0028A758A8|nr:PTS fructose transporter subunit IIB [Lacrimispora sp.]